MKASLLLTVLCAFLVVASTKAGPSNPWIEISPSDSSLKKATLPVLHQLYLETKSTPSVELIHLFAAYYLQDSAPPKFRIHFSVLKKGTRKIVRHLGRCRAILQGKFSSNGQVNYTLFDFSTHAFLPPGSSHFVLCSYY